MEDFKIEIDGKTAYLVVIGTFILGIVTGVAIIDRHIRRNRVYTMRPKPGSDTATLRDIIEEIVDEIKVKKGIKTELDLSDYVEHTDDGLIVIYPEGIPGSETDKERIRKEDEACSKSKKKKKVKRHE